jgi:hypothetical protein
LFGKQRSYKKLKKTESVLEINHDYDDSNVITSLKSQVSCKSSLMLTSPKRSEDFYSHLMSEASNIPKKLHPSIRLERYNDRTYNLRHKKIPGAGHYGWAESIDCAVKPRRGSEHLRFKH